MSPFRILALSLVSLLVASCATTPPSTQEASPTPATAFDLIPAEPAVVLALRPDAMDSVFALLPPLEAFVEQAGPHLTDILSPLVVDREITASFVKAMVSLGEHRDDSRPIYLALALTTDRDTRRSRRLVAPPSAVKSPTAPDVFYRLVQPVKSVDGADEGVRDVCSRLEGMPCRARALETEEGPVVIFDVGTQPSASPSLGVGRSAPAWRAVQGGEEYAVALYLRLEGFFDLQAARMQAESAEVISLAAPEYRQMLWARSASMMGALSIFDSPHVAEFEEMTITLSTANESVLLDLVADMTPYGERLFDALHQQEASPSGKLSGRTFESPVVDLRAWWNLTGALALAEAPVALRPPPWRSFGGSVPEPSVAVNELFEHAETARSLVGLGLLRSPLSWLKAYEDFLLRDGLPADVFAWPQALWLQVDGKAALPALALALGFNTEDTARKILSFMDSAGVLTVPNRIRATDGGAGEAQFSFPLLPEDVYAEETEGLADGLTGYVDLNGLHQKLSSLGAGQAGMLPGMLSPDQRPQSLDRIHVRAQAHEGQARIRVQLGGESLSGPTFEPHRPDRAPAAAPDCFREATRWFADVFNALANMAPESRLAAIHHATTYLDEAADQCEDEELGHIIRRNAETWRQWNGEPFFKGDESAR